MDLSHTLPPKQRGRFAATVWAALAGLVVGILLAGAPFAFLLLSGRDLALLDSLALTVVAPQFTPVAATASAGTPALDFDARLDLVAEQIEQAQEYGNRGDCIQAVLLWNEILAAVPEYGFGWYRRGWCYRELARSNNRFLTEYQDYMNRALADVSQAIDLGTADGDVYLLRARTYDALAGLQSYRTERDLLAESALADFRQAADLGSSDPWAERHPGFVLAALGRCEAALAEFEALQRAQQPPSAGIYTGLADSSLCQGEYGKALENIDLALQIRPSEERRIRRAIILHNLGRLDEALEEITATIEAEPLYRGDRYFVRALIYYDLGEPALAQADLDFGQTQVWDTDGVRSYVAGRLALDRGDTEAGVALLEYAEASMSRSNGGLLDRVRRELTLIEGSPPVYPTAPAN